MKAIQKELGEADERTQEIEALRQRIEAAGMPRGAQGRGAPGARPARQDAPAAAEYTVARTYIDWLVSMHGSRRRSTTSISRRQGGPRRGPRRAREGQGPILEYLAVKKIRRRAGSDPLLRGPPGVGKTSLGRSIARRRRKFHRISLGGNARRGRDPWPPAHVHRRAAGQIIQGLRRAGTRIGLHARRDRQARHGLPW